MQKLSSLKKLVGWLGATLLVMATLATIFSVLPEATRNRVYVAVGLLEPSPTWTLSPTPEPTQTPTNTIVPSDTPQPTQTYTLTITPQPTATATYTNIPTFTPTRTPVPPTITPTPADSITSTLTATLTTQVTSTIIVTLSYPCSAQIISRSSAVLNVVHANPSNSAPLRDPIEQGLSVNIFARVEERRDEVWYQITDTEGRSLGWITSIYVIPSASCPP